MRIHQEGPTGADALSCIAAGAGYRIYLVERNEKRKHGLPGNPESQPVLVVQDFCEGWWQEVFVREREAGQLVVRKPELGRIAALRGEAPLLEGATSEKEWVLVSTLAAALRTRAGERPEPPFPVPTPEEMRWFALQDLRLPERTRLDELFSWLALLTAELAWSSGAAHFFRLESALRCRSPTLPEGAARHLLRLAQRHTGGNVFSRGEGHFAEWKMRETWAPPSSGGFLPAPLPAAPAAVPSRRRPCSPFSFGTAAERLFEEE